MSLTEVKSLHMDRSREDMRTGFKFSSLVSRLETAALGLAALHFLKVNVKVLVTQSCQVFCYPVDSSLPGSSLPGMLQARILEWVAIPFFRGSS